MLRLRSERLAAILEQEPETEAAADLLCSVWRGARAGERGALRCLMSLLEVRVSALELLRLALQMRRALRACQAAARGAAWTQHDGWRDIVATLQALAVRAGVQLTELAEPGAARRTLERRAAELLEVLLAGRIRVSEMAWLSELAEVELRATAKKLEAMAERVGTHDGERIARLLPVLAKHEERIRDTRAILVRLTSPDDLVRRTAVFVGSLETSFHALLQAVARRADGRELAQVMVLLAGRTPLAEELAFSAGLVRSLSERLRPRGAPALDPGRALLLALRARQGNGLRVELDAAGMRSTGGLWEILGVLPRSGGFTVVYDARRHGPLLAEDGAPELVYPIVRKSADLRQLALANIANEHVLCGLLAQPRAAGSAGLVEQIAIRTRSLRVLLEIAKRRELHTGSANRNVPRALLWHPSAIPVSALRKFVHVRFVDRAELSALCGRGSRARPEVRQLAYEYLATLSSI